MSAPADLTPVPDCPPRPVLDSGPFCAGCGVHRAMTPTGLCPGCSEDKHNADRVGGAS